MPRCIQGKKILHVDAEVDGSIGQGAERKCFQLRSPSIRASVSGPQFFQTFPAVLVQRIVVGDPLAKQQSSNAVRVLNALPQQRRALARDPCFSANQGKKAPPDGGASMECKF